MIIRGEQMGALDNAATADLHHRIALYLRRKLPDHTNHFNDATLLQKVTASASKADKYGVKTDRGIAEFVCIAFVTGENFDEVPDIQTYLTQPNFDPDFKIHLLSEQLVSTVENRNSIAT